MSDDSNAIDPAAEPQHRVGADWPFFLTFAVIGGTYVLLVGALLAADVYYMVRASAPKSSSVDNASPQNASAPQVENESQNPLWKALATPEIRYSIKLSLISCTITAILSLWVAVPIGYLLSRYHFPGRNFVDALLDIPIVLPPLVIGLSLLILFQYVPRWLSSQVVYQIPAVICAQFMVSAAFAVRTMRSTFDQIDARREQVALTLGCTRAQAFGMVTLPEAKQGLFTAGTLAWARALGEFGPLLVFAGATRNKTEVLSTTVFLELSIGNLEGAVAVSMIMVVAAVIVLVLARTWGNRGIH